MPDVRLTPQVLVQGGVTPTYTGSLSTSDVYLVRNDGDVLLHFKKTGAGNATITVQTPGTVDGNAIAERTFTVVATTGDVMAGSYTPAVYNDQAGDLRWSSNDITGLSVAVIRKGLG